MNAHISPEYDSLGAGEEDSEGPCSEHHQPGPPPLRRPVERQQRGLDGDQSGEKINQFTFTFYKILSGQNPKILILIMY